jgi:hypothetical protein
MLSWLASAVRSAVSRGKVTSSQAAPPAGRGLVSVQLLTGESKSLIEHLLPYGRSALPTEGDALLLTVGTDRNHVVCAAVDDPATRILDLAAGEFGDSDGASRTVYRGDRLEIIQHQADRRAKRRRGLPHRAPARHDDRRDDRIDHAWNGDGHRRRYRGRRHQREASHAPDALRRERAAAVSA